MTVRQPFHPLHFPLSGRRLMEASAGTGKTYNIANLYLRLLIGHGTAPKKIEQILVVTFTRAATDELRGRIREKIEQALQAFRGAECQDSFIRALLQDTSIAKEEACVLLQRALVCMDEASIFTIHGFAVRAIQSFLFETGALAEVELSEEGNGRQQLLLADIWRELQLSGNPLLQKYVEASGFSDRDSFSDYFSKARIGVDILPSFDLGRSPSLSGLLGHGDAYVQDVITKVLAERKTLAARWRKWNETEIKKQLDHAKAADLVKRVNAWLASSDLPLKLPEKKSQIYSYLMSFLDRDITGGDKNDELLILIGEIIQHANRDISVPALQKQAFCALLLRYVQARMADVDIAAMHVDEVITLLNHILSANDSKSRQLQKMITATYPVCMVDEFQDTDPAQFNLFNRLYGDASDSGFFMIGDPKQSIYQFRGADIFSYLHVKQEVQQIYPLDTNYRSKAALVEACNLLFQEAPEQAGSSFVFEGIEYEPVNSCEANGQQNKGELSGAPDAPDGALIFVGNPDADEKINGDTLRWKYARDTAQRIQALCAQAQITRHKKEDNQSRPLRGGDIAVLVRSGREANAMRYALLAMEPPIPSVYQSQKDSVFASSVVAEDLFHILQAMDNPGDKSLLKKAMVTLFFRGFAFDFTELDQLDNDSAAGEQVFESLIGEFESYRREWENHGVLSAMYAFVRQRELMGKMAALPDGDRLLTDFRHLGELLQGHELECGSREQLLIWYSCQLLDDSEMEADSKRIRLESDENLVKIVTIHVSKGLEYPVVFLPFFYLPWTADLVKNIPLYHPSPGYQAVVDYSASRELVRGQMQQEILAEEMRLLYVALTRAIHQCYIGISASTKAKKPQFHLSAWAHLLGLKDHPQPPWSLLESTLRKKLGADNPAIVYKQLFDGKTTQALQQEENPSAGELLRPIPMPALFPSHWVITSYSALAHAKKDPGLRRGGNDEGLLKQVLTVGEEEEVEVKWVDNIRYTLRGSSRTGDCLHEFFEELALGAQDYLQVGQNCEALLQKYLRKHGLEKPESFAQGAWPAAEAAREKIYAERRQQLLGWFDAVLDLPLLSAAHTSSLRQLFLSGQCLPEMNFDFALGTVAAASIDEGINVALHGLGLSPVSLPVKKEIDGLMTGSIDLLFIHDKKVYVLDYKSNTLGKAPFYYSAPHMDRAMQDNRFDLQACIYSVAAHRYMQQRLGSRYAFDGGEYCFGGTFYLFLRGMGTGEPGCERNGIYFKRPTGQAIAALDGAFKGERRHA